MHLEILLKCRLAQALIVICILNAALLVLNPLKNVDPEGLRAAKTWVWWATRDLLSEHPSPNIVLLGSSLMMNPLWQTEADFQNKNVDIVTNRRVRYLEAALKKIPHACEATCFNFALPGARISDDYMIIRALLKGQHKPKIVVLGLSPRDLVENGLHCPAFSDSFRYLQRLTPIEDLVNLAMPYPWQRIRYYTNIYLYIFGKKVDIQILLTETCKQICNRLFGYYHDSDRLEVAYKDAGQAIYKSDVESGVWVAQPHIRWQAKSDLDLFRRQYQHAIYCENQKKWLRICLELCQQRGIRAVILNMPLTAMNIASYPPGVYDKTVDVIKKEAAEFQCPFVDLNTTHRFKESDFTDMWHMGAAGGAKVLDSIASQIVKNPVLLDSLKPKPIEKQRGLLAERIGSNRHSLSR